MAEYAMTVLQKFIDENKINIRAKLNLKSIWNLIDGVSGEELRRKGWISRQLYVRTCAILCIQRLRCVKMDTSA